MRYFDKFGYTTGSVETEPGVWEDVIVEHEHIGTVENRTEAYTVAGSVLPQYRTTTAVSVLSDGTLKENYTDLRYVTLKGQRWTIGSIVEEFPRLTIYIGEVYHGPIPEPTP